MLQAYNAAHPPRGETRPVGRLNRQCTQKGARGSAQDLTLHLRATKGPGLSLSRARPTVFTLCLESQVSTVHAQTAKAGPLAVGLRVMQTARKAHTVPTGHMTSFGCLHCGSAHSMFVERS